MNLEIEPIQHLAVRVADSEVLKINQCLPHRGPVHWAWSVPEEMGAAKVNVRAGDHRVASSSTVIIRSNKATVSSVCRSAPTLSGRTTSLAPTA